MRFADKLFFVMTALLTIIFMVFGTWMLASYFQNLLNREVEQGQRENQMFQYLYEMAYQSMAEYGDGYAVPNAIENAVENLEKDDIRFFALDEAGEFYYGEHAVAGEDFPLFVADILKELGNDSSYVYGIRQIDGEYYLINICRGSRNEGTLYLGLCRNVSPLFADRQNLMNQYRLALGYLLLAGGISIYLMCRYLTSPIRRLGRLAERIAGGDLQERSNYRAHDEIGELAHSFNRMADHLEEQIKELAEEAKRKELEAAQKEDFTAAFAHELKTPLTSIIGYADMLNSIELTEEERREAYFYIFTQGKRLESLSHKLLELVSIDNSMEKGTMAFKPVSTKHLEENLRVTMRPIFRKKEIKGRIVMEKATFYGDEELLLSLFYNLLDNAVKAVETSGFILLKGTCFPEGYEIKVVDNGRGIPEKEIGRITEAFYMVDKSRSRKEGGAGIGMALCQKIVNLHGASLRIESKEGEGTVMKILFPLEKKK